MTALEVVGWVLGVFAALVALAVGVGKLLRGSGREASDLHHGSTMSEQRAPEQTFHTFDAPDEWVLTDDRDVLSFNGYRSVRRARSLAANDPAAIDDALHKIDPCAPPRTDRETA
jgi:hypothetical protein